MTSDFSKKVVFLITFDGLQNDAHLVSGELHTKLRKTISGTDPTVKIVSHNFDITSFLYDINYLLMKRHVDAGDGIKIIYYLQVANDVDCTKLMTVLQSVNYLQIPFVIKNLGMVVVEVERKSTLVKPFSFVPRKSPDIYECLDQMPTRLKCRLNDCRGPEVLTRKTKKGAFTNLRIFQLFEGQSMTSLQRDFDSFVNKKLKFVPTKPIDGKLFHPKVWTTVSRFYDHYYILKEAKMEEQLMPYMYTLLKTLSYLTLPNMFKVYGVVYQLFPKYRVYKFNDFLPDLRGWRHLSTDKQQLLSDPLEYQLIVLLYTFNLWTDEISVTISRSTYWWLDTAEIKDMNVTQDEYLINLYWHQMHVSLQKRVVKWEKRFLKYTVNPFLTFLEQKTHDYACEIIEDILSHVAIGFPYAYQSHEGVESNFGSFYQNLTDWLQRAPEIPNIYYSWPDFKQWTKNFKVPNKAIIPGDTFNQLLEIIPEYAHESFQVYYHSPRFLRKISKIFDDFKVNATSKVIRQLAKTRKQMVDDIVTALNGHLLTGIQQMHDEMSGPQWIGYRSQTFYKLLQLEDTPQPLSIFCRNVEVFFGIHNIPIPQEDFRKLTAINTEFQNIQKIDKQLDRPINTRLRWGLKLVGTREYLFKNSAPVQWALGPSILLLVICFFAWFRKM